MELFIGSLLIFGLTALAMAIGTLFRGRPMHAGCRNLPGDPDCVSKSQCGGACRRST